MGAIVWTLAFDFEGGYATISKGSIWLCPFMSFHETNPIKTNPFTVDAFTRVIQLSPNILKLSFHLNIYSTSL